MIHEYKTIVYRESFFSSALLGSANINPQKFSIFLNQNALEGWRVVCIERDIQRAFLLFRRDAYVVIMERPKYQTSDNGERILSNNSDFSPTRFFK